MERLTLARYGPDIVDSWASTRAESRRMQLNVSAHWGLTPHDTNHLFVIPTHPLTMKPMIYGEDRGTLSGILDISRRVTLIEMNMDWKANNNTTVHDSNQRLPPARGGTAQKKIIHLANWSQLIHPGPASSLTKVFLVSSQSCVSTLTHYSSELLLPRHQGPWMIWQRTWSWQTTTTTTLTIRLCEHALFLTFLVLKLYRELHSSLKTNMCLNIIARLF